jgi:hypothetical protein
MPGQNVAIRPKHPLQEDSEVWLGADRADSVDQVDQADLVLVDRVALEAKEKADPEAVLLGGLPEVLPEDQDSEDLPDPEILSMINPKKSETPGDCSSKDSNAHTTV